MNLNQLHYFVAAADCRSFTKAAAQFYISQTAITQQIQALEQTLGVTLFDRTSRPISLTPSGNAFLVDAKAILSRVGDAMNRVHEASVGFAGNLSIGYTKGFERSNLSNVLRTFHAMYPNILISCYRCDTDALAAGLLKDEYDIIFTWDSTELVKDPGIATVLVEKSPLMVALYNSHPFSEKKELKRAELKGEPILYMTPSSTGDSAGDMHFFDLYHNAGFHPKILFRSNDVESILMMIAAEEGISLLPGYITAKLDNAENITFVPLVGDEEIVEILAAWSKDIRNPVLSHFVEHLDAMRWE